MAVYVSVHVRALMVQWAFCDVVVVVLVVVLVVVVLVVVAVLVLW